jgi:hypothetical protein
MAMTPCIGEDFVGWKHPLVATERWDSLIFDLPHVDHGTGAHFNAERWAAGIPVRRMRLTIVRHQSD